MNELFSQDLSSLTAKERLLHTAHRLFYLRGIRATGIDMVIAEAKVTKVTFYRHFPTKNDLVHAYLEYRHHLWIDWFHAALERHRHHDQAGALMALVPALQEWFDSRDFRGCAFINGITELGELPQVVEHVRQHKLAMREAIATLLPPSAAKESIADALALAVDGSIVRAQVDGHSKAALDSLAMVLRRFAGP